MLQPPSAAYFKPQGIPLFRLEQVVLALDEYEAVRLVDREGLQQAEAAQRMKISRATCARILDSAHHKIAEALTEGKAIRIEGGSFVLGRNRYRCRRCDASWETPAAEAALAQPVCPHCQSDSVTDLGREVGLPGGPGRRGPRPGAGQRGGRGRGGGRGWRGGSAS